MSNLIELKPVGYLNPFGKFCCTIGNLPSSYMTSLTYEEQLLWLCDYLKNTVIPAVNTNAEAVLELQNLYIKLKDFVNGYFNNLDVQNEINNKLDKMALDGTLENIINQDIFSAINNDISLLKNKDNQLQNQIENTNLSLNNKTKQLENDFTSQYETIKNNLNADNQSYRSSIDTQVNQINSRVNELTSLPDGSTTGDAELQDIRISTSKLNGKTFSSAGNSVRGQFDNLINILNLTGIPFEVPEYTQLEGFLDITLNYVSSSNWFHTSPIFVKAGKSLGVYIKGFGNVQSIARCNASGEIKEKIYAHNASEYFYKTVNVDFDSYYIISYSSSDNFTKNEIVIFDTPINKKEYDLYKISDFYEYVVPEFEKTDYYFIDTSLNKNQSDGWGYTSPIKLEKGKTIAFKASGYGNVSSISLSDEYGNLSQTLIGGLPSGTRLMKYTATSDIYVVLCYPLNREVLITIYEDLLSNLSSDYKSLYGKKWVAFGDSLTEHNDRAEKHYYDYIHDNTSVDVNVQAVSGTGYKRGDSLNFMNRINNIGTQYDCVTIFGSFNDLGANYNLGNPSDTTSDTIAGCINLTLDNFYNINPTGKIGLITPTPWASKYTNNLIDSTNMNDYANLIINICKRRGIPYLDLYHTSGLRPWDEKVRLEFYTENGVTDTGGVHPNSKGNKFISSQIEEFVKSLII